MVQQKLDQMMTIPQCLEHPNWMRILQMSESSTYHSQKSCLLLMENVLQQFTQSLDVEGDDTSAILVTDILIKDESKLRNAEQFTEPTIGQKYVCNFQGMEPDLDMNGLPIPSDKSKYKAVAMEYCQRSGWKKPTERPQSYGSGYRVTVMFGPPNKERSASGDGLQKKEAMYEAYTKLLPQLVPRDALIKLLVKW